MFMYYAMIKLRWSPSSLYEFFKNNYEDKRFKLLIKSFMKIHMENEQEQADKMNKNS